MNIVIIEDEKMMSEDLAESIMQLESKPVTIKQLYSVKESIAFLKNNPSPDLIFSDIQLGDGLSFEIFVSIEVAAPIIFCTAYDEYALDAFKANGIDYMLKPFSMDMLESALRKYHQLKKLFSGNQAQQYNAILQALSSRETQKPASILVYHLDKILPIKVEDIALFYLKNEITHLLTFSGKVYFPNKSLEELEKLNAFHFFRANRQYLVCRKVVADVSNTMSRKLTLNLTIPFKEVITISKERAPLFLDWLTKTA
ncbi:MAG TPA: LytTR family DNA-binding domain-containing protein [Flavisolibacter sp.]|nr:LytTR family DNA-binding domain-containing protein [Flavisolibacter sp.]